MSSVFCKDVCKDQCQCRVPIYCLPCIKANRRENKRQKHELRKQLNLQGQDVEREANAQRKQAKKQAQLAFDQRELEYDLKELDRTRQKEVMDYQKERRWSSNCEADLQPLMDQIIKTFRQIGSTEYGITNVVGNMFNIDLYRKCILIQFTFREVDYTLSFVNNSGDTKWEIVIHLTGIISEVILKTKCNLFKTDDQIKSYIIQLFAILPQ
jgi:hypothetical protein